MDLSEEEGILPILNQVRAFQSKWIAKNKQCETLDSFLTTVTAENKQFRAQNEELKSNLNAANFENETMRSSLIEADTKNKELQTKCETLESSLEQSNAKNKEFEMKFKDLNEKCTKLTSSLNEVIIKNKDLKISSETLETALKKFKAKNKELKLKCKDLDAKCQALESFLNSANKKKKELGIKLEESKKEVIKVTLEKRRILVATLRKIQNKLLTNPLYAIIDRLKDNINALDAAAKNTLPSAPPNNGEVEVVDIASSDDDASTLSLVSELRSIEEDFNEYSYLDDVMSVDNDDKRSINVFRVDENAQPAMQNPNVDENNEQNSPLVPQNCDPDIRNEFSDDNCYDSDISLSVHTDDVTSTTGEEELSHSFQDSHTLIATEHSYSDRVSITPEKSLPESSNIERTSTIVNNQTSSANEQGIDEGLPQNNSVILPKSPSEGILDNTVAPLGTSNNTLPEMKQISIPKPVVSNFFEALDSENISPSISQSKNKSNCDNKFQPLNSQTDSNIASLQKKYGRNLKFLNPVIVLTPLEYERPDLVEKFVQLGDSTSS